mmetsp:Transcript_1701/g.2778  ORF Transcript_1701/g.2778 Transcript_1701/m.2778 type:complete len:233 (+) Transcript_1701:31-729(+)
MFRLCCWPMEVRTSRREPSPVVASSASTLRTSVEAAGQGTVATKRSAMTPGLWASGGGIKRAYTALHEPVTPIMPSKNNLSASAHAAYVAFSGFNDAVQAAGAAVVSATTKQDRGKASKKGGQADARGVPYKLSLIIAHEEATRNAQVLAISQTGAPVDLENGDILDDQVHPWSSMLRAYITFAQALCESHPQHIPLLPAHVAAPMSSWLSAVSRHKDLACTLKQALSHARS